VRDYGARHSPLSDSSHASRTAGIGVAPIILWRAGLMQWAPPLDWGALAVKLANVLGVALALVGALWVAERGNV